MGDYGLSWDEPTRWRSGDTKLDYYQDLLAAPNKWEAMQKAPQDVYPGLYDIPLAIARRSLDVDPILLSRIWNVCFGLLCVWGTFVLARLTGSNSGDANAGDESRFDLVRIAPLLAVAFLLSVPSFYGHISINPKDVPFAATYVWALVALVALAKQMPKPSWGRVVAFGVAMGVCMATRPPGVVFIGYFGLFGLLSIALFAERESWFRSLSSLVLRGLAAFGIAVCVLLPWWPAAHRNPFGSSAQAVEKLQTFSSTIPVLFAGQMYDAGSSPWYYALWMLLIKLPLWMPLAMVAGTVLLLFDLRKGNIKLDRDVFVRALVVFAALFPLAYVLVRQPAIHNGIRHLLYLLPPLMAALSWGWQRAFARRGGAFAVAAVVAILLASSLATNVRLHPYQYIYYNQLAGGPAGALNRYETEYWYTSGKEAVDLLGSHMRSSGEDSVRLMVSGPWQVIEPYLPAGVTLVGNAAEAQYYIGNTQMRMDAIVEGEEIDSIRKGGLPVVVLKAVSP